MAENSTLNFDTSFNSEQHCDDELQFEDGQEVWNGPQSPHELEESSPIVEAFKKTYLTPKELMEIKRLEKKREEESNLTFKPKLAPYKGSREDNITNLGGSRFDKLYTDAMKRKQLEGSRSSMDALTFKPNLMSSSRSSSRERRSSSPSDVVERLYSAKGAGKHTESAPPDKNSFQPTITKRASSVERVDGREASERLYLKVKEVRERRERLKAEQYEREQQQCTFAPKINSTSRSLSASRHGPDSPTEDLSQRLLRYEEAKQRRLEEAKKVIEEQEAADLTFKPTLRSTKRVTTPTRQGNVYERLASSGVGELRLSLEDLEANNTFKPLVNSRRSTTPTDGRPVHERLFQEAERRRITLEAEIRAKESDDAKTNKFIPKLEASYQLSPEEREGKPVFDRLASNVDRQQMQNILTQVKNDLEMEECTFRPQICADNKPKLKSTGAEPPVHVRLNSDAERLREDARRREQLKVEEDMRGATFAPTINPKSAALTRSRKSAVGLGLDTHFSVAGSEDDHSTNSTTYTPRKAGGGGVTPTVTPRASSTSKRPSTPTPKTVPRVPRSVAGEDSSSASGTTPAAAAAGAGGASNASSASHIATANSATPASAVSTSKAVSRPRGTAPASVAASAPSTTSSSTTSAPTLAQSATPVPRKTVVSLVGATPKTSPRSSAPSNVSHTPSASGQNGTATTAAAAGGSTTAGAPVVGKVLRGQRRSGTSESLSAALDAAVLESQQAANDANSSNSVPPTSSYSSSLPTSFPSPPGVPVDRTIAVADEVSAGDAEETVTAAGAPEIIATASVPVPLPPPPTQTVEAPIALPPAPPAPVPAVVSSASSAVNAADAPPGNKVLRGRKKSTATEDASSAPTPEESTLTSSSSAVNISTLSASGGVPESSSSLFPTVPILTSAAPAESAAPAPAPAAATALASTFSASLDHNMADQVSLPLSSAGGITDTPPAGKVLRGRKKSTTVGADSTMTAAVTIAPTTAGTDTAPTDTYTDPPMPACSSSGEDLGETF